MNNCSQLCREHADTRLLVSNSSLCLSSWEGGLLRLMVKYKRRLVRAARWKKNFFCIHPFRSFRSHNDNPFGSYHSRVWIFSSLRILPRTIEMSLEGQEEILGCFQHSWRLLIAPSFSCRLILLRAYKNVWSQAATSKCHREYKKLGPLCYEEKKSLKQLANTIVAITQLSVRRLTEKWIVYI